MLNIKKELYLQIILIILGIVIAVLLIFLVWQITINMQDSGDYLTDSTDSCTGDIYDCGDFSNKEDAQRIYDYCFNLTKNDIHNLDNDGDGIACEGLI